METEIVRMQGISRVCQLLLWPTKNSMSQEQCSLSFLKLFSCGHCSPHQVEANWHAWETVKGPFQTGWETGGSETPVSFPEWDVVAYLVLCLVNSVLGQVTSPLYIPVSSFVKCERPYLYILPYLVMRVKWEEFWKLKVWDKCGNIIYRSNSNHCLFLLITHQEQLY